MSSLSARHGYVFSSLRIISKFHSTCISFRRTIVKPSPDNVVGQPAQRRQSGLKSGKSWIRVKKNSILPDKFLENFGFF